MNPKTYEKSVDQLAEKRKLIREKNPIFKAMNRIFEAVFTKEARDFNFVSNIRFFRKGFPTPETESKLNRFLDKFANLVHFYNFIGDDEIIKYLSTKGISVSPGVSFLDTALNAGVIDPIDWDEAMGESNAGIPTQSKEVMEILISRREEILKEIHEIKSAFVEKLEETVQNESIGKPHVNKASHLRYKQLIGKKVEGDIAKVHRDADESEQAISIIKT